MYHKHVIQVPQGERRKLVAVDDCYWNVLRKHLKQSTGKWCLYLDGDEGILPDFATCSILTIEKNVENTAFGLYFFNFML